VYRDQSTSPLEPNSGFRFDSSRRPDSRHLHSKGRLKKEAVIQSQPSFFGDERNTKTVTFQDEQPFFEQVPQQRDTHLFGQDQKIARLNMALMKKSQPKKPLPNQRNRLTHSKEPQKEPLKDLPKDPLRIP